MGAWLLYGLAGCESADSHITLGARSLLFVFLDYLTFCLQVHPLASYISHFCFFCGVRGWILYC